MFFAPRLPSLPGRLADRVAVGTGRIFPGLLLCCGVTLAAFALQTAETRLFGRAWLESLVLAILAGAAIRTAWAPAERWRPGITFSAKFVLEIAVMLLGASVSLRSILGAGPGLLAGIALVVATAIAASYGFGRLLGLRHNMALLVACGNAICGNSAIAAVAPVIQADAKDVAASIAYTAVLGVGVVLGLPLLAPLLHLSDGQYGVFAGLTVYAVPQVLAAAAPVGVLAMQTGTLVKLVRVLMLGPVVLGLSLLARRAGNGAAGALKLHRLAPWFILGFLALAAIRSTGWLPQPVLAPTAVAANLLTVVSMAALGLEVDVRVVARAGGRVMTVVTASLAALGAISLGLIHLLGIV
jgi:uncharacterized integral membrane protein (TIGR00698 family)